MVPSMIEAGGVCAGRGGCARARAPKAPEGGVAGSREVGLFLPLQLSCLGLRRGSGGLLCAKNAWKVRQKVAAELANPFLDSFDP